MNLLKFTIRIILPTILIFLFSCKKENTDTYLTSINDQIGKVETRYKEGNIKIENLGDPNAPKIETEASADLKKLLREELEKSCSKQVTYLKSTNYLVGVIKGTTCGPNKEISIYMDCEDGSNNLSAVGGSWYGACERNSAGNVTFRFCVVDGTLFKGNGTNYAVLGLSSLWAWPGASSVTRYFDNEDRDNINSFTYDGANAYGQSYGGTKFGANIQFSLIYFPSSLLESVYYTLPTIGIDYGVFSNYSAFSGFVKTDDEDNNNANSLTKYDTDYNGYPISSAEKVNSVPGVIEGGVNTLLYVSQRYN